ncbi:FAD-dependent oxidoreductase [Candidatus Saccharibacteria bacterium]|nr:FAD-dependent oxidoreductase [Candidatus Saccharibacteria bacterium]
MINAIFHHANIDATGIQSLYFSTEQRLKYTAGQFIEMQVEHNNVDERGKTRWLTLSSSPCQDLICITTKFNKNSSSYKQALQLLLPGDRVMISQPMGDFVLPKDDRTPLVFIAGGIGITPYISMIRWLLDCNQTRNIQLIYSVSTKCELAFTDLINQDFIELTLRVAKDHLTAQKIVKIVKNITNKQLYIAGPEAMTESLVKQFYEKYNINQDRLITDYFLGY